jgi:cobaltochelatase CobT
MIAALLARLFSRKADKDEGYRVYTRRYDRVVTASQLNCVLGELNPFAEAALVESWSEYTHGMFAWKTRASFQMLDLATSWRNALSDAERADTLVSVLVDQSGSMRGPKMLMTAMATDILQSTLGGIGIPTEVLGFTTKSWRGGRPRVRWRLMGRPRNPGRLCELLHIVYKGADENRTGMDGWSFRYMLRPDLPKENVDGEALEWAVSRMRSRQEKRKILLVISDGAPVDDSTLTANSNTYLDDHLRDVITRLHTDGDIRLCAIGLGYDVNRYYSTSAKAEVPDDLPGALGQVMQAALIPAPHILN